MLGKTIITWYSCGKKQYVKTTKNDAIPLRIAVKNNHKRNETHKNILRLKTVIILKLHD